MKNPYDSKAAGKMGGRPIKSSKPRQRKSIAFLGEGVDVLEQIAKEAGISFADVLHVAMLQYSIRKGVPNEPFLEALIDKAESLGSDSLKREIKQALRED